MSDIPAWPPASGWTAGQADMPAPILVAFGGSFPQRRLTVLIRFILFIPHYFVLYVLSIAAEVIALIGWFCALFAGRLPGFAADFLSGYLRWQARVMAYLLLLTDHYPPFTLDDDAGYPVRIALRPGRLNRLAVLFRIILAIPAAVVTMVLLWGACTIALFVTWLIVLVAGRMPDTLYAALAAVLRYQVRFSGYAFLLTSAYPSGLFGDQPGPSDAWSAGGPGGPGGFTAGPGGFAGPVAGFATDPSGFPLPGGKYAPGGGSGPEPGAGYAPAGEYGTGGGYDQAGGYGEGGGYGAVPGGGFEAAPGGGFTAAPGQFEARSGGFAGADSGVAYAAPGGAAPLAGATPSSWRLILSGPAKRLIVVFLVLGVLIGVAYVALFAVVAANGSHSLRNQIVANAAAVQVQTDFAPLNRALNTYDSTTGQCPNQADSLGCATAAARTLGGSFDTFAARLRNVSMPAGPATAAAGRLDDDAASAGAIFGRLAAAKTGAAYNAIVTTANQALNQFGQDYQALGTALNQS